MKQIGINDISKYLEWDFENLEYIVKKQIKEKNIYTEILENNIVDDKLLLKNTFDITLEQYPHINTVGDNVIKQSIKQSECIKDMVFKSIENRNGFKINFVENECENINHINLAKRYVKEFNNLIYKYKVSDIYCNRVLIYSDNNYSFIGHIDVLVKTNQGYIQVEIKTSRINYVEKYNAQLYLNKKLIEVNKDIKIKESFILNIREQQVFLASTELSKKEQFTLLQSARHYW
ncbi:hypothetical protein SCHIN_v1c11730 [Spiroplasma chinense]|uniref:Uncharacterized protein n=1 Tax=Spiroplasma chinense TaxID=216932 RepID=A0A5B9Y6L4_9MOLU|nr:hypothetical protein [Spiroplasma chinense]QEH62366.1 hypothetical protein SCHIN_v1c11730 [Spiroplasma chinense]